MYCTPADVRGALVPGGGDAPGQQGTPASMSNEQLLKEIETADTRIDTFIGSRYAIPVAAVDGAIPLIICDLSRDLAAYYATLTFRRGRTLDRDRTAALRYEDAMALLRAVSTGRGTLPLGSDADGNESANDNMPSAVAMNPYEGNLFTTSDFELSRRDLQAPPGYWFD